MVYDIYSVRIGAAQRNIAVLRRILEDIWDNADLFELEVYLRVYVRKQRDERLMFMERVRSRAMREEDRKELEVLMANEHTALREANEHHRRDVASGVKY
jgi:hypothetical protein